VPGAAVPPFHQREGERRTAELEADGSAVICRDAGHRGKRRPGRPAYLRDVLGTPWRAVPTGSDRDPIGAIVDAGAHCDACGAAHTRALVEDPKRSERETAFGILTIDHPFAARAWTDPAVAPIVTETAANASNNRRM
jgi:hypothetical protein